MLLSDTHLWIFKFKFEIIFIFENDINNILFMNTDNILINTSGEQFHIFHVNIIFMIFESFIGRYIDFCTDLLDCIFQ